MGQACGDEMLWAVNGSVTNDHDQSIHAELSYHLTSAMLLFSPVSNSQELTPLVNETNKKASLSKQLLQK